MKIDNVKVLIVPDGRFYFCQGVDIDYAAQGDTLVEAMDNFTRGLRATLELIKKKGGLQLGPPPPDVITGLESDPDVERSIITMETE